MVVAPPVAVNGRANRKGCKECGGRCKECGGSSICVHDRRAGACSTLTSRLSEEAADTEVDTLSHLTAHKKSGEFMRDKAVTS